jgi:hypothetical protein
MTTATKQADYYTIVAMSQQGDLTRINCDTMSDAHDIVDAHKVLGAIYSLSVVFTDGTQQVIA